MEDLLGKWGLEYSFSQNIFFSAPLKTLLVFNREAIHNGVQHDFILVGIFDDKESLERAAELWIAKTKSKILYTDIYENMVVKSKDDL